MKNFINLLSKLNNACPFTTKKLRALTFPKDCVQKNIGVHRFLGKERASLNITPYSCLKWPLLVFILKN